MARKGVAFALALMGAFWGASLRAREPALESAALPSDRAIRQFEQLANAHRTSVGCAALQRDSRVASVAQAHAEDMVRRDFFDHRNPDGKTPFDRLRAAGVRYTAAAENIAFGYQTGARVLEGWIKSPGHRRNLENCLYTHHGVGLSRGKWVHVFVRR